MKNYRYNARVAAIWNLVDVANFEANEIYGGLISGDPAGAWQHACTAMAIVDDLMEQKKFYSNFRNDATVKLLYANLLDAIGSINIDYGDVESARIASGSRTKEQSARADAIVDELIALDDALNKRHDGCLLAYNIWTDFNGDINAKDIDWQDQIAAFELYQEITEGYELDKPRHMFALSF